MPIIISAVAAFLLMMSMRRRRPTPQAPPIPEPQPRSTESVASPALRRDLDALMVELQDLSRRISAEIDTRFAKLEAAMKDADRRIAVLNRLTRESGAPRVMPASSSMEPADENRDPAAAPKPPRLRSAPDVRHTVIYELADAGFTPVEIARDLGRTPGEVELILNLRRQAQTKT